MMRAAGWRFAALIAAVKAASVSLASIERPMAYPTHSPRSGLQEDGDLGKAAGGDDICLIGYPELVEAGGRDVEGSIRPAR
jgi:hypothetical protein